MVQQNNAQIVKYVEDVNPIPHNFVPPFHLKVQDLIVDNGESRERDLGKRYWLVYLSRSLLLSTQRLSDSKVRQRTALGFRSQRVYSDLPGLYDIDKTLFSRGTLSTLLSYRALLSARIVDKQPDQDFHTATRTRRKTLPSSADEDAVSSSSGHSLDSESRSVTLRFFLEVNLHRPR